MDFQKILNLTRIMGMCLGLFFGSTWAWFDQEAGEPSLKVLKTNATARSAALSGAGFGRSEMSEATWNPIASTYDSTPMLVAHEVRYSEHTGASLSQVTMIQPMGSWRWQIGGVLLDWADLQGRDDDAHSTGNFGAGMWDARGGFAYVSPSGLRLGLSGRYAYQYIAEFGSSAVLGDVALGQRLGKSFDFSAGLFNWGWIGSFDTQSESLPVEARVGISYESRYKQYGSLLHLDLSRHSDEDPEIQIGLELDWNHLLVLRSGTLWGNGNYGLSAGVALRMPAFQVAYGYGADRRIQGNHTFSLAVLF